MFDGRKAVLALLLALHLTAFAESHQRHVRAAEKLLYQPSITEESQQPQVSERKYCDEMYKKMASTFTSLMKLAVDPNIDENDGCKYNKELIDIKNNLKEFKEYYCQNQGNQLEGEEQLAGSDNLGQGVESEPQTQNDLERPLPKPEENFENPAIRKTVYLKRKENAQEIPATSTIIKEEPSPQLTYDTDPNQQKEPTSSMEISEGTPSSKLKKEEEVDGGKGESKDIDGQLTPSPVPNEGDKIPEDSTNTATYYTEAKPQVLYKPAPDVGGEKTDEQPSPEVPIPDREPEIPFQAQENQQSPDGTEKTPDKFIRYVTYTSEVKTQETPVAQGQDSTGTEDSDQGPVVDTNNPSDTSEKHPIPVTPVSESQDIPGTEKVDQLSVDNTNIPGGNPEKQQIPVPIYQSLPGKVDEAPILVDKSNIPGDYKTLEIPVTEVDEQGQLVRRFPGTIDGASVLTPVEATNIRRDPKEQKIKVFAVEQEQTYGTLIAPAPIPIFSGNPGDISTVERLGDDCEYKQGRPIDVAQVVDFEDAEDLYRIPVFPSTSQSTVSQPPVDQNGKCLSIDKINLINVGKITTYVDMTKFCGNDYPFVSQADDVQSIRSVSGSNSAVVRKTVLEDFSPEQIKESNGLSGLVPVVNYILRRYQAQGN